MIKRFSVTSVLILFVFITVGCSGGKGSTPPASVDSNAAGQNEDGGTNDSGEGGNGAPSATHYLFYQGSLVALNPGNPSTPIVIEPQPVTGLRTTLAGRQVSPTRVTGVGVNGVVYGRGGKLWKVSASGLETPLPVRVSNETAATTICSNFVSDDLATPEHTAYVYELGGADGKCSTSADNVWRWVRLNMDAFTAPGNAAKPVIDLGDNTNGAVTGWLATADGVLYRYDPEFGSAQALKSFSENVGFVVAINNERVILLIDTDLYIYDDARRALSPSLHQFSTSTAGPYKSDGSHLYFADGGSIYKLPLAGESRASLLVTQADIGSGGMSLNLTNNYVVYAWRNPGTLQSSLQRIPKGGGAAQTLFSGIDGVRVMSAGDLIYYSVGTSTALTAYVVRENGNPVARYEGALWWGQTLPTTIEVGNKGQGNLFFLMEGYTNPSQFFANGSITAFEAATHTRTAVLGRIPNDVTDIVFNGYGDAVLGLASSKATPQTTDVFFANTRVDGSLLRLTSTGSISEKPVW